MTIKFNRLLSITNIVLVLFLLGTYFICSPSESKNLTLYSLMLISAQAGMNIFCLERINIRILTFYILLFFTYFMQNLFFWSPLLFPELIIRGDYFLPQHMTPSALDRTFEYLTLCHMSAIAAIILASKGSKLKKNKSVRTSIILKSEIFLIIFSMVGFLFFILNCGLFFKASDANLPILLKVGTVALGYLGKFLFRSDLIILLIITYLWTTNVAVRWLRVGVLISICLAYILVGAYSGSRAGVAFVILIFLINWIVFNRNWSFNFKHLAWPVFIIGAILVNFHIGTKSRDFPADTPGTSLYFHSERLSARMSGINYVHLFLNFDNPVKEALIDKEMTINKRIKAGINQLTSFRSYNETNSDQLFKYFFEDYYKTISSALELYGTNMFTLFGEVFFLTKSKTLSIASIFALFLFVTMIFEKINIKMLQVFFMLQFHNLFISYGIIDWFFPNLIAALFCLIFFIKVEQVFRMKSKRV